ncbi:MAG: 50S ribosomal protein L33 [Myxococcota bacterium]|nr:50S ribosomal protein L33 [Myxococcota bacterium]
MCVECGARNYHVSASRTGRPIRRKKFCPRCGRHTVHEQSK